MPEILDSLGAAQQLEAGPLGAATGQLALPAGCEDLDANDVDRTDLEKVAPAKCATQRDRMDDRLIGLVEPSLPQPQRRERHLVPGLEIRKPRRARGNCSEPGGSAQTVKLRNGQ